MAQGRIWDYVETLTQLSISDAFNSEAHAKLHG